MGIIFYCYIFNMILLYVGDINVLNIPPIITSILLYVIIGNVIFMG